MLKVSDHHVAVGKVRMRKTEIQKGKGEEKKKIGRNYQGVQVKKLAGRGVGIRTQCSSELGV